MHEQGYSQSDKKIDRVAPIPNQTGLDPWQIQNPLEKPCMISALLHQQGEFLVATHQNEEAARQNLVNTLARNSEVHTYILQMQVRQLEQEADARCSQRQKKRRPNKAVENQRENLVTEVTSEV